MIVEIHGAGFDNKGAQLMLRTAVTELRRRVPGFVPAIDPTCGPYHLRCELALYQTFPPRSYVGHPRFSRRFRGQRLLAAKSVDKLVGRLFNKALTLYGCANLSSIQGLVDIAGFAYSDEWGPQPSQDFAALTAYLRARNRPVIMLPQAYGPFHEESTRAAFKKVLNNAVLVFARDQQSYEHALELASEPSRVAKAPDITLFYPDVSLEESSQPKEGWVAVVPNARMLDQGKEAWGDSYEGYLQGIVEGILELGFRVRILVHDTSGQDLALAQRIRQPFPRAEAALVEEDDPIALKQMLARSMLVVGSRYHSLVAAFSKQVPAIAIGWSHKYDMLFRDFDCERHVLSHETSIEIALDLIRELLDLEVSASARHKTARYLREMYAVNQTMWKQVADVLASHCTQA